MSDGSRVIGISSSLSRADSLPLNAVWAGEDGDDQSIWTVPGPSVTGSMGRPPISSLPFSQTAMKWSGTGVWIPVDRVAGDFADEPVCQEAVAFLALFSGDSSDKGDALQSALREYYRTQTRPSECATYCSLDNRREKVIHCFKTALKEYADIGARRGCRGELDIRRMLISPAISRLTRPRPH